MTNPYLIHGPALISFSGGRTSGYMLRHIINAHGGRLPDDVVVAFANTGRERSETLDFVQDCATYFDVPIVWLEWRDGLNGERYDVVSHNAASRDGEPFAGLVRKRNYPPNPVTRFCTSELKIRVIRDYCRSLGWDRWVNVVGLRGDEPDRVVKAKRDKGERWTVVTPLHDAGVTEADVLDWWSRQPFNLRLQSYEGNCDLCFLKSAGKITRIMRERPDLADWWIAQEAAIGATFRADRPSYAALLDTVQRQGVLPFDLIDDTTECNTGCTDQEPDADWRDVTGRTAV